MRKLRSLPFCLGLIAGVPSTNIPMQGGSPMLIRLESARISMSSSGCAFQTDGRSEGVVTPCTRTSAGKSVLTFTPAWTKIPNCTATAEGESTSNVWIVPTLTNVTIGTFDYGVLLGAITKTYGDQSYAIKCSGTQD